MENSLKGKTAAVTGASSGIGQVIAETLGKAGAHVFMCGRSSEALEASRKLIEEAGGSATCSTFDMRDTGAVKDFVAAAAAHAGRLDIMVNNAGVGHNNPIIDADPEEWREMLDINIMGLLVGCQTAVRKMRETGSEGHIINISSIAALRRDSGVYGATKHAVNCINASLRAELEDDTIRVTSIMPGVFATNFIRNFDRDFVLGLAASVGIENVEFDESGKVSREVIDELQSKMAAVAGNTEEIAKAVLYVVGQPTSINIEEVVIRPPKSMTF